MPTGRRGERSCTLAEGHGHQDRRRKSTAHRIDDAWVYGFPELDAAQRSKIASSTRVANPGCYATGFIAVTRPLVDAGLLKPEARLACSAVSGYSGGGKQLTAVFEEQSHEPWGAYGWNLDHKHLPEMAFHGRLEEPPVFLPAVGRLCAGHGHLRARRLWAGLLGRREG